MATLELTETRTDEAPRRQHQRNPLVDYPPSSELEFTGCKAVRMTLPDSFDDSMS